MSASAALAGRLTCAISGAGESAPSYVNLNRAEAEAEAEELARPTGVTLVRVVDVDIVPRPFLTFDRLALLLHHGRAVRSAFI